MNRQLPDEGKLIIEESSAVAGENSPLDSLGLVMLMINIEEHIVPLGINVSILDIFTESDKPPFLTIGEMSEWLVDQSRGAI
ncbi:hypothetical protein OAC99_01405 [Amylibacter sp.]|nr:hypothetical protein [Amylibacter sp.]